MNITDVETPEEIPVDIIQEIFARQRELIEKYHVIEENNGFNTFSGYPLNLNHKLHQARLKDFAWRMTEEFTEATDTNDPEHKLEEVIDALHFFVELNILAGHYPTTRWTDVYVDNLSQYYKIYPVIERVGCAMNCLKNKPWKQSHMLTDEKKFHMHLEESWVFFFLLLKSFHLTLEDVYIVYFKKSEVNKFRQRSKY